MLGIYAGMMMTASRQSPDRKDRRWTPPARFWAARDRQVFDQSQRDD